MYLFYRNIAFRYLATGASQAHLAFSFRLGHSTVGSVLRDTLAVIWKRLVPVVMQPPTEQTWRNIARDFQKLWQCPNCIGAMDGKHIKIRAPPISGSGFYNCKGYFSIVLLAVWLQEEVIEAIESFCFVKCWVCVFYLCADRWGNCRHILFR